MKNRPAYRETSRPLGGGYIKSDQVGVRFPDCFWQLAPSETVAPGGTWRFLSEVQDEETGSQ
jgi:hypothetical protein